MSLDFGFLSDISLECWRLVTVGVMLAMAGVFIRVYGPLEFPTYQPPTVEISRPDAPT